MPAIHTTYDCHCGKQFKHAKSLTRHKRVEHQFQSNTHQCHCGEIFKRKDTLKRHERLHEAPSYKCSQCSEAFYRKDKLMAHQRWHPVQMGYGPGSSTPSAPDQTTGFTVNTQDLSNDQSKQTSSMSQEEHVRSQGQPSSDTDPQLANIEPEAMSSTDSDEGDCDFEDENALNGSLKKVTLKAQGLSKFDPLRLFKEREAKVKGVLLKQMKKKGGIKWYC
ncbi:unnamed protein product, partial [Owenia fusiformis]